MKFKDLVDKHRNNAAIFERLFTLHPDSKRSKVGYQKVLKALRHLEPQPSDLKILIERVTDDYDGEQYNHVSGYHKDEPMGYAIEYTPWEQWLDMYIMGKTLEAFSELDILCECLWEMTWSGYDQAEIQGKMSEIMDRVEDVKSGKAKTIPFEEVKKRLKKDTN